MDRAATGRPRGRARRRTALVAVLTATALLPFLGPAAAAPRTSPVGRTVIVDCFTKPQVRPGDFLLACGDGNNRLTGLHWTSWGPQEAVARGTDMANDCRPYCAAGTFRSYPVTVTLSRPEPWPGHPGVQHFTRLRMVFTGTSPDPLPAAITYELWD
ncbi:hypothetical protein [Streptomyces sp. NPDC089919]|uniref:hypothetical protein n=1 Tax=Streptomyces sp. NPDC089919 TaxID=3155188 RepID=UPI003429C640